MHPVLRDASSSGVILRQCSASHIAIYSSSEYSLWGLGGVVGHGGPVQVVVAPPILPPGLTPEFGGFGVLLGISAVGLEMPQGMLEINPCLLVQTPHTLIRIGDCVLT